MKPADCHCHLDFKDFDEDRQEVLDEAEEKLDFIVCVGCDPSRNEKVLEISSEGKFISYNLGLHPTSTEYFNELGKVKRQIRDNEPSAIGEIGLDHYHVNDEKLRDEQEHIFRELLSLAEDLDLPVNVHSREAESQVIDIIGDYSLPGVLIHCFNGSEEEAMKAAELGYKIGVTTQVLYSDKVQDIVKSVKLSDIVLETDSPFLNRNGRNKPSNVLKSVSKIAELKKCGNKKVISETTSNARTLFGKE